MGGVHKNGGPSLLGPATGAAKDGREMDRRAFAKCIGDAVLNGRISEKDNKKIGGETPDKGKLSLISRIPAKQLSLISRRQGPRPDNSAETELSIVKLKTLQLQKSTKSDAPPVPPLMLLKASPLPDLIVIPRSGRSKSQPLLASQAKSKGNVLQASQPRHVPLKDLQPQSYVSSSWLMSRP